MVVESELGEGTAFRTYLPVVEPFTPEGLIDRINLFGTTGRVTIRAPPGHLRCKLWPNWIPCAYVSTPFSRAQSRLHYWVVMICPSCGAAYGDEGSCERCGASVDEIGSEETAVAPDVQAHATVAYTSQSAASRSHKTLDSSRQMSIDATLPGAQDATAGVTRPGARVAAAAAATPPPEQDLSETAIGTSEAMIGHELGSYRLLEVLGEGGMGRVYLAEHTKIGRRVALKMLHSHLARSPSVVRRFFDEARAVNRILHEHIVEITDFIENDGGDNYFIMEYLRGEPLTKMLTREGGTSTLARALSIGVQVASALSAVHVANIVHRDLKPENIFLTERGGQKDFVKLLDFGIAKLMSEHGGDLNLRTTEAGVIMGTPAYMSPEQASAKSVDHRADIYALGVILYELCTGTLPFMADNFGDMVVLHKTATPVVPSKVPGLMQDIPGPLDALILQCLEKSPEDRPQTSKEVEDRLHEIAWEFAVELENFDVSSGLMRRKKGGGDSGKAKLLAGLGVLAASGIAFVMMSSSGGDDHSEAQPAAVSAAPQPSPDAAPGAESPQVLLSFSSQPPGAMVFPQGDSNDLLGITPFTLVLDRSDEVTQFDFRKPGYEATTQAASLTEGGTINAQLTAVLEVQDAAPPAVKPKPKRRNSAAKKEKRRKKRRKKKKRDREGRNYREGAVIDPFAN